MSTIPESVMAALAKPFQLTPVQIEFYQQNRFIKLKQVFDEETILFFNDAIGKRVASMNDQSTPLEQRSTYGKAFLQLFNLWKEDEVVKEFVFSKRLAKIASDLMQVEGVRMYHDQALIPFKYISGWDGVNFTANLPYIRTSPDHGVALDIVGTDAVDSNSMYNAITNALDIYHMRARQKSMRENPLPKINLKNLERN